MPKEFIDKCQERVNNVAKVLNTIADGKMWCNEDASEWYDGPDMETDETGELHQVSMYDFFNTELPDVELRVNLDGTYRSVRVRIDDGGPAIDVDTKAEAAVLHWGTTTCEGILHKDTIDLIDSYFEEMMEAYRR